MNPKLIFAKDVFISIAHKETGEQGIAIFMKADSGEEIYCVFNSDGARNFRARLSELILSINEEKTLQ
jgi:hypothetical protein